ncbi:hypothetical protein ACFL6S_29235, partial [Candidatus Poribacteria bacterium]
RYKRDTDNPGIAVRKVEGWEWGLRYTGGPSPDGRYISFTRWDGNLAVRDLTTGEQRTITDEGGNWGGYLRSCGASTWSPDGKIAYSWNCELRKDSYSEGYNELRIIGLDGSESRALYRSKDPGSSIVPWDWSQDGKSILGRQGESDIVLVSVADGLVRILKSLEGLAGRGSLSPDGRYVAYARSMEKDAGFDVFLLATDSSGEEVRLEGHTDSNNEHPVWTADGKSIVFVCNRDPVGNSSLWLTPVADGKQTGKPQLVTKCAGYIIPQGFTREGSLYYGIRSAAVADICIASVNMETGEVESQPTRLRCEGDNWHPVWSPDGKSLAYMSVRYSPKMAQRPALVIRSMETVKEREIHPETEMPHATRLHWSPDSRSILCSNRNHFLLDVQTGHVTTIAGSHSRIEYPVWSRDGKTIFYILRHADKEWGFFSIAARDLATGEERELYTGGYSWSCLMVSPDGQEMFFYDEGQTKIKVIPTAGGEPRVLCAESSHTYITGENGDHKVVFPVRVIYPVTWTPDGRHLLFIKAKILSYDDDEQINELWRIPTEGGEPEKLRELDKQLVNELRLGSFHPDGQSIAFAKGNGEPLGHFPPRQSEIWAMDNLLTTLAADK